MVRRAVRQAPRDRRGEGADDRPLGRGGVSVGDSDTGPVREKIANLHAAKTTIFNELIDEGAIPLRSGVLRLVDEAIERGVRLAVCSTSNERAVSNLVSTLMGPERAAKFQIFAGDVVANKKLSPDIYLLALETMELDKDRCVHRGQSHRLPGRAGERLELPRGEEQLHGIRGLCRGQVGRGRAWRGQARDRHGVDARGSASRGARRERDEVVGGCEVCGPVPGDEEGVSDSFVVA